MSEIEIRGDFQSTPEVDLAEIEYQPDDNSDSDDELEQISVEGSASLSSTRGSSLPVSKHVETRSPETGSIYQRSSLPRAFRF